MITKKELKHLEELARLEISQKNEEQLLSDLEKILDYFEELKKVDTGAVVPMTGGTFSQNVFREDNSENRLPREEAIKQFPEKEKGFLKIPPVFSAEETLNIIPEDRSVFGGE